MNQKPYTSVRDFTYVKMTTSRVREDRMWMLGSTLSVMFSKEQAAGNTQWLDANIPIQRHAIKEVTYQVLSSWKIAALGKTNCQLQVIELNKLQRKMKA
jgi:hypothetical protein